MYLNWDNHVKYKIDVNLKKCCRTSFFPLILISVDDIWVWLLLNQKKQTFVKQSENAWLNYKTFIETRMG